MQVFLDVPPSYIVVLLRLSRQRVPDKESTFVALIGLDFACNENRRQGRVAIGGNFGTYRTGKFDLYMGGGATYALGGAGGNDFSKR